jgi:hypothetical protein
MSDPQLWPDVHDADHTPTEAERYAWPDDCTLAALPEQTPAPPQQFDDDDDSEDFSARWWPNLSGDWT